MYIPKHFEIIDETEIGKFIEANSFGQLISLHDTAIVSTHMPFLFDAGGRVLVGHLAKANPQWQQIQKQKVLVTLQGEHTYVSPGRAYRRDRAKFHRFQETEACGRYTHRSK
jgi:transcriptional regulator